MENQFKRPGFKAALRVMQVFKGRVITSVQNMSGKLGVHLRPALEEVSVSTSLVMMQ